MKKALFFTLILMTSFMLSACFPFSFGGNFNNNNGNDTTYDDGYNDDYYEDTTYDDSYDDGGFYDDETYDDTYYYYAGTYVCYDDAAYSPGYYPALDLYTDGTFYFTVNLGDGMGGIWGTYAEYGEYIELYVEGRDFSGYEGDDTEIIPFWIIDDWTLRLHEKNFGITYANSIFEYN